MATGRNIKSLVSDIVGGFVVINPIFLKPFDAEQLKIFYETLQRKQNEMRAEPFPYGQVELIRNRNIRLQRVYNAISLIKNFARERRINLG
ncbi:MAG TPA: hypothetical protein VK452_09630 [Dissulfurispiraceae bacterium]|nr:hypothetical protein [Dissulfurispiraceae bacterium]